jgi:hypothetical protein
MDSRTAQQGSGRVTGSMFLWIVCALLAYVLSAGPAANVRSRSQNKFVVAALDRIFTPVMWLNKTPLKGPLIWYLNLWLDVPSDPRLYVIP